ncbi:hypothetical protein [Bradyrhizobium sp. SZCCHNR1045]|uniref:hypothetical protein n=1 Tax=Bradyrhizobium sp. SZCCHNR1045 TaxID=3057353 RepID=UPI00291645B2|nr:hypothetical protein [Bradyrhizobium sp. SZCCHNR1045]
MLRVWAALLLSTIPFSFAHAESCKPIVDNVKRLACYDTFTGIDYVIREVEQNPQAVASIVAALFALVGGVGGPLATLLIGRRQAAAAQTSADAANLTARTVGFRELAKVRLDWLKALRDNLSEYHSILMTSEDPDPDLEGEAALRAKEKDEADDRRLSYLGTQLDLLLNQKKQLQKTLWGISDEILGLDTKEERQARDQALVEAARAVLDFEWQKIKREMRGDLLQEPPGRS